MRPDHSDTDWLLKVLRRNVSEDVKDSTIFGVRICEMSAEEKEAALLFLIHRRKLDREES